MLRNTVEIHLAIIIVRHSYVANWLGGYMIVSVKTTTSGVITTSAVDQCEKLIIQ